MLYEFIIVVDSLIKYTTGSPDFLDFSSSYLDMVSLKNVLF